MGHHDQLERILPQVFQDCPFAKQDFARLPADIEMAIDVVFFLKLLVFLLPEWHELLPPRIT